MVVRAWDEDCVGYWAAEHKGEFVGVSGLRRLSHAGRDCWNLYYRFRPDVWGRGLATEAACEAMAFAREQVVAMPVIARTRSQNEAAKRVAARCGMKRRADLDADGFEVFVVDW